MARSRLVRLGHLATLALLMAGCAKLPPERGPAPAQFQAVPRAEQSLGSLRWGLALSGGGIRSATFSIGVMKALYDEQLLDSVQVVSTVSGGGYAGYWLFTREMTGAHGEGFGQRTFSDEVFTSAFCEVNANANFFSYRDVFNAAVGRETFIEAYNYALMRTFGRAVVDSAKARGPDRELVERTVVRVHDLAPQIQSGRLPYWIINATVVEPKPTGWRNGLYEFTPFIRGNEQFGYVPSAESSMPVRQAVAISGAAFRRALKQRVPNPHSTVPFPTLELDDGGKSENLAAVALVRRRVSNIIIVDAEQDAHYKFPGYTNLKRRLAHWGYELRVDGIDNYRRGRRLESAAHIGTVRSTIPGDPYTGRVIYIKMSLPQSLKQTIEGGDPAGEGERFDEDLYTALEKTTLPNGDWDCERLQGVVAPTAAWLTYGVRSYSQFRPETLQTVVLPAASTEFPQYSTGDQSYFLDQTLAYVGLGYLEGIEAVRKVMGRAER